MRNKNVVDGKLKMIGLPFSYASTHSANVDAEESQIQLISNEGVRLLFVSKYNENPTWHCDNHNEEVKNLQAKEWQRRKLWKVFPDGKGSQRKRYLPKRVPLLSMHPRKGCHIRWHEDMPRSDKQADNKPLIAT